MKHFGNIAGTALVALLIAALSVTAPADMAQTLQQLTGKAEAPEWTDEQLRDACQQAVDHLIPLLAAEDVGSRYAHQMTLMALAAHASRPGADGHRQILADVLVKAAQREDLSEPALVWIVRQFEIMGHEEAVPVLAGLLQHEDRHLSDQARRALEKNPSPQAVQALRQALDTATENAFRAGVIHSLGQRGDTESIEALQALAAGDGELEALAAITALGDMGVAESARALLSAHEGATSDRVRRRIEEHTLMIAHQRINAGAPGEALAIYRALFSAETAPQTRNAALIGRVRAGEENAARQIARAMNSEDPAMRAAAVMAAREAPDHRPVEVLAARLDQVAPLDQKRILTLVAERPAPAAQPYAVAMLQSDAAPVRLAAIAALAAIDRPAGARALLHIVATGDGADQRGAQQALATMNGDGVEAFLKQQAQSGDNQPARLAAIEILGQRRAEGMRDALLAAAADSDATLAATALSALENLVVDGDAQTIAAIIAETEDNAVRSAAEPVLRAAFRLANDRDAVALTIYEPFLAASTAGKQTILRAFTALGGERALSGVSTVAIEAEDAEVRDSAIRALAAWPEFEAADILTELADDDDLTLIQHALVVQGAIRLAVERFDTDADGAVALTVDMIEKARRTEEKVAALGALAGMPTTAAAEAVKACLDDDDLQSEAAQAALRMARRLAGADRDAAQALVNRVRALDLSDEINQQADGVFNR